MSASKKPDYDAARIYADLETGTAVRPGSVGKDSYWVELVADHAYRQGLAARLTPEERETLTLAAYHLEGTNNDALAVQLRALAGKGAG